MQKTSCNVAPGSDQDLYTIALQNVIGEWVGIDADLSAVQSRTLNAPPPQQVAEQFSWHMGRGQDRWLPDQSRFADSQNAWRTTQGKFHPTLLWEFAKGLQSADSNMPGDNNVVFKGLYGANRVLAVAFTASATYDAAQALLHIRKGNPAGSVGAPGTLTVELCADGTGKPGSVLLSKQISATEGDTITKVYPFEFSSATTLTIGNTYYLNIYGGASDSKNACWEIACDPSAAGFTSTTPTSGWTASTFSPYFMVTVADTDDYFIPFEFDGALYAVKVKADGTASSLFINGMRGRATSATSTTLVDTSHGSYGASAIPTDLFINWYMRIIRGKGSGQIRQISDNDGTSFTVPAWNETPDATSEYVVYGGLNFVGLVNFTYKVTGKPTSVLNLCYFPHGDSDPFTCMSLDYTDADDHVFDLQTETGTRGDAFKLVAGYDASVGSVVWRVNNDSGTGSGGKILASRAPVTSAYVYTSDLVFNTGVQVGSGTWRITNLAFHNNKLYVLKEDSVFSVESDRPIQIADFNPSPDNGLAFCTASDKNLYYSRGGEVFVIVGSGTAPTGLNNNIPVGRSGVVSDLLSVEGWVFATIDAGDNTSSVMMYAVDTTTWGEHLRGYAAGKRMRAMSWHPCPNTFPELWVNVGNNLVRQQFPRNGIRPVNDTGVRYWYEAVLEMSPIDMLKVDPKHFSRVYVQSSGMSSHNDDNSGNMIVVDHQTDNLVETTTWQHGGTLQFSPIGMVDLSKGGKSKMALRFRINNVDPNAPVIIESIRVTLFTRQPLAKQWQIQFRILPDDEDQPSLDMLQWLRDQARNTEALTMKSTFHLYHNIKVTIADEPFYVIDEWIGDEEELEARVSLVVAEVI